MGVLLAYISLVVVALNSLRAVRQSSTSWGYPRNLLPVCADESASDPRVILGGMTGVFTLTILGGGLVLRHLRVLSLLYWR